MMPSKTIPKGIKENFMKNETTFQVRDPEAKASYGMVRKIATQFSKNPKCPKDIKWGTIHGHFVSRLNDTKKPLTSGQVAKILSMKALPSDDLRAMRGYKKLVALTS